jgi:hypothetical protein
MYIKQSELFTGTSMDFFKKFRDISEMYSHKERIRINKVKV